MTSLLLWSAWTDVLPEPVRGYLEGPIGIAVLVLVPALAVYVLAASLGSLFRQAPKEPETKLREDLSTYPHPPGSPGPKRLTVEGVAGRIRLIVVAPSNRGQQLDAGSVETLLNSMVRGIKEIIQKDRPRIRIWPPQLSHTGFAPTFHRLSEVPDGEDGESPWVLIAGPANAAGKPILLGLAILTDEPCSLDKLTMTPDRWAETLRVVTIED